jgi:topoisomerase-4 subunit A
MPFPPSWTGAARRPRRTEACPPPHFVRQHILRLDPGSAFKKCAKIVGDVMGRSILTAISDLRGAGAPRAGLRLALSVIEGQGNFGNIGDNAAAHRYTEAHDRCRASSWRASTKTRSIKRQLLRRHQSRSSCLAVPNLLANGAQGIAVGMATSISPHNIAEL